MVASQWPAESSAAAQIIRIWSVTAAKPVFTQTTHNGGLARRYQGLPAPLAIPATGHPDSGEAVFLCIASARVNFRFCRESVG
jgi:hypothetical protein